MARSPLEQLELIMNLTGSPSPGDLESCHPDACCFVLSSRLRDPNLSILYALTPDVNELTVHLLGSMLKFNPVSSFFTFFWFFENTVFRIKSSIILFIISWVSKET
ncbi:unnamed protein product [Trichobilharzia regenti]|nr:unnamed protein product [Trichobilharzia regenti]